MDENTVERLCRGCGGVIFDGPAASQKKAYAGAGKFCSQECAENGEAKECDVCGQWFRSYRGVAKRCESCSRKGYLSYEPIKRKASTLGANILGGRGKTEWLVSLIGDAVGKNCPYCDTELSLDNISLDHKVPIGSSEVRRKKSENREAREVADRRDNLHLVCRKCNQLKGKIPHDSFLKLLAFLSTDKIMEHEVLSRLRQSGVVWGHKRR